jgi:hypothetical protein
MASVFFTSSRKRYRIFSPFSSNKCGGTVSGSRNGGFALAPRDDLDAAMVNRHWPRSFQKI